MTQLVLIRHGQASFGAANYDRLSETGERQARLVGRHLAAAGQHFDVMLAGDLQRQQRTAELVNAGYETAPAIHTDPAFNEYDADAIFAAYTPRVFEENPELGAARDQLKTDRRLFQKVFEQDSLWISLTAPSDLPFLLLFTPAVHQQSGIYISWSISC